MEKMYYELSAPQKAIWLTEQYYQSTNVNNVCGTFYSAEKLDFDLLKKSLNVFLQSNDSFKIQLTQKNNEIKQYFCNLQDIDFDIVNIANKEEQTALEEKIASGVFDMLNSLLFKIVLFRYPDGHGGFVINSHHIISDSWTNGIVANDVALIYAKLKKGEVYEKDESLSYKTYLKAEANYQSSTKFEKDKTYWESVFQTVPEVASIPSTKETVRGAESLEACRVLLPLDNGLLVNIRTYCEKNKVSLYNFFMAIFALYLGRVSGLDEFVIGTPILNRTNFKEKQTTGMFINTLPLKINLVFEKTFLDNLKDIAVRSMSLLRHQKYSFQYILEDVRKKESDLPKLYNVMYSYQITKMNENMDSLNHSTSWTFNKTITDDLDIHMFEWNENDSIQIAYDYRLNKYNEKDMLDIHSRILHIIGQVIGNESILLKDVEIVTHDEKKKILYQFNNTSVDYPKDKTIVDLFEEQVQKTPDRIAVVFEGQKLTYKELNEKANQLARYLIEKGCKSNDIVAIIFHRSLEMMIAILGALKAGAAYLPIDPEYPEDRIEYILKDCACQLLVTDVALTNMDYSNQIHFNLDDSFLNKYQTNNLHLSIPNSNRAYLIYTSGSTGTPKGVILKHLSLTNLIHYCNHTVEYLRNPVYRSIVSVTTVSFDIFIFETLISLQRGLKVVIANTNEQTLPFALNELIKKEKITAIQTTPSRMQTFLNHLDALDGLKDLQYITLAGEQLPVSLAQELHRLSGATIYNGYGPSETTVFATLTDVTNKADTMTIGHAIANSQIYVLDKMQGLCPIGVPGELYISGDCVGLGYIGKPEMTQKSFVKNPYMENQIMYQSGDLGYYTPDGELVCLGRLDHQVKIHGLRIELQEIEAVLSTIAGIKTSVVVKTVNQVNADCLCAYYTVHEAVDEASIKKELQRKLPAYMVPEYYIQLPELPYTPNGKLDKKSLPQPNAEAKVPYEKPRNQIDALIIDYLSGLLDRENISIHDSFYRIGGDSLSAISLSTYLATNYHATVSIKDIMEHPVIKDLSDFIAKLSVVARENTISASPSADFYPASSAQKSIYYACMKDKTSLLYNISGGIVANKPFNEKKLEEAFQALIRRHSSLRTCFEVRDNEVVQIVKKDIPFSLSCEKVNTDDIASVCSDFIKPFDLSKAPLFRAKLFELPGKYALLLDMHHLISDGASLHIMIQELFDLYQDKELSEKPIEYKDFAVWQQEQLKNKKMEVSKEFWIKQYQDDIPLLSMPSTFVRPSIQSYEGDNYFTKLAPSSYEKILEIANKLGTTPYVVLLSVYYILLSKYTAQNDIVVGTPVAGREHAEIAKLCGMFVNSLPIRANVDHSLSFKDFCSVVKEVCLNNFAHQNYPFEQLVKDLKIKADPGRNPIFDTMFIYQSDGYPTIDLPDVAIDYFLPNNSISKFDLSLEIVPLGSEYQLRFEYCTKLFDEDFIQRFATHYVNILDTILEHTEIKIAEIDMLSEKEKHTLLYDFNKYNEPTNEDTFVSIFEEQAKQYPGRIALTCDGKHMTYAELNEKANSLAHFLLQNNVKPNDIIAVLTNRSFETIVSMLAILKAGAAFVNLDPTYPVERTAYYLEDCKPSCVLKQKDLTLPENHCNNVFEIDLDNAHIYSKNKHNPQVSIDLRSLSYIIYTSGSTGTPKGVVLNHLGLANMCKAMTLVLDYLKDPENHALLSVTSTPFDIFVYEIVVPLSHGMHIVLANNDEHRNPKLIDKLIREHGVDVMTVTPSLMKINYDHREPDTALALVKNMVFGGEPLSEKFVHDLKALASDITVYNIYGPSEITVLSNVQNLNGEKEITVGPPILNTKEYVLDSDMNPVPVGVTGEIYIGGVQVGYGYLGKEELTQQKFLNNPFDDGMMFKSGDIGKWTKEGKLQCLGRLDHQVKLRGLRIELGEIEKTLETIPEISEAVVNKIVMDNTEFLCGYYVATKDISDKKIRAVLKQTLPYYMVPSYFVKLDSMPYSINRKIDRKALPLPTARKSNNIDISNISDTENKLISLCKKILALEEITLDDNFFDLGGDSISAIHLQIEAFKHGFDFTYADIFAASNLRELASMKKEENADLASYDYSQINALLQRNDSFDPHLVTRRIAKDQNILLIGATGFVGIHILDQLLKNTSGDVYCLIRDKDNVSPEVRLQSLLDFYFDKKYNVEQDSRIKIIHGDITMDELGISQQNLATIKENVSTVINSSAIVKHYGPSQLFKDVNVVGTQRIVDFCMKYNKRLFHVSTSSVSGNAEPSEAKLDVFPTTEGKKLFRENNLFIGQHLDNIYSHTKYEGEIIVLNGISNGLDATILRIGNITNRYSDGKFQQNVEENAFVQRLKSFINIGKIPDYLMNHSIELTPVDLCAEAIVKIIQSTSPYTVLHICNRHLLPIRDLLHVLNANFHYHICPVSMEEMTSTVDTLLNSEEDQSMLNGIIHDLTKDKQLIYTSNILLSTDFSEKYLKHIGFHWKRLNKQYIKKYIKYLISIQFLNKEDES